MPLTLSSKIQNTVPDSIEFAPDLNLAIRANGEERTSFIDLAGNIYPAEIPQPANAPTFTGLTGAANGITPVGFYGYRYVYAATTRYPLVNGGKAIGGSIAPRGNPSPAITVNMNVDLNYVNLTLPTASRKDVSEIWVFRTVNYPTAADALIAANAGLCFYVGKVTNVPGGAAIAFQDTVPSISLSQIEFDNFAAPTFRYVQYIPPYFWGIGNDQIVIPVSWAGQIITITNSNFQWFDGRNGQFATINGIATGGIDGLGTFLFKAGDTGGFNQQINCILTKDGITPETLVPASGTGYITIKGNGSVLYRSKENNPFAWGYTQIIGNFRNPQVYAIPVATGDATAIKGLPEDQQLKVDFKNPAACYTYNLRLASSSEFSTTKKLISSYSVGSHASQFIASFQGKKVIWGWDPDTFAILQSDGNSQYPVSDNLYQTLRNAVRDPFRIQFSHGICDEENELNCLWIPFIGEVNFENNYTQPDQYKQTSLTDLLIYQHYPSGKWGTSIEFDLTAATKIRNLHLNKLQILGGTDTGLVCRINDNTTAFNNEIPVSGFQTPVSVDSTGTFSFLTFPNGTFTGVDPILFIGVWGILYNYPDDSIAYCRVSSVVNDILYLDMIMYPDTQVIGTKIIQGTWTNPATIGFYISGIPQLLRKTFDFSQPTQLKRIEELYLKGSNLNTLLTKIWNYSNTRYPFSFFNDNTRFSEDIFRIAKPALPLDDKIHLQLFSPGGTNIKGMGLKMT